MYAQSAVADRVRVSLQALPADVCGNGDFDRQRAAQEVKAVGSVDGAAVQEVVRGAAHARTCGAGVGDWVGRYGADGV